MSLIYLAMMINEAHDGKPVDQALLTDRRETELRNAVRRGLGLAEKPVKWIELNDEGEAVASKWSMPFDGTATHMVISPDGEFLAIAMRNGQIRIHRSFDGKFLGEIPADDVGLTAIEFRRTDGRLMVVRVAGKVEFWNPQPLRLEREAMLAGFATTEACLGGEWLASRQANEVGISVYDLQTGKRR